MTHGECPRCGGPVVFDKEEPEELVHDEGPDFYCSKEVDGPWIFSDEKIDESYEPVALCDLQRIIEYIAEKDEKIASAMRLLKSAL